VIGWLTWVGVVASLRGCYTSVHTVTRVAGAALRLLNWTVPQIAGAGAGDFPTVVRHVIANRTTVVTTNKSFTIGKLNVRAQTMPTASAGRVKR
jgi:hypothetical protein